MPTPKKSEVWRDQKTHLTADEIVERLEAIQDLISRFTPEHRDYLSFALDADETLDSLIDHLNHQTEYED